MSKNRNKKPIPRPAPNGKTKIKSSKNPKPPAPKKGGVAKQVFKNILKAFAVLFCIGAMTVSVLGVQAVQYVVAETQDDDDILDLENIKLNQTSYIMALNPDNPDAEEENDWVEYQELVGPEHRIWVPLDKVPQHLKDAIISTEDRTFYKHHGFNLGRTVYALVNEVLMLEDNTFGASTIDQQLVKNLTGDDDVSDASGDRTTGYQRKMREIFRAWGLNNRYSKDMILEAYLNTMSLSENLAGVQAGAQEYFGKDVSELTLAECATIAGITQKPNAYSPYKNPEKCVKRRNDVLLFMYQTESITEAEFKAAAAEELVVQPRRVQATDENPTGEVFNYFSDTVFEEVVRDLMDQKGWTRDAAVNYVYTGGLRIYATVDHDVQNTLESMYSTGYDEGGFFVDPSRFPGYEARLKRTEEVRDDNGEVVEVNDVWPQSAAAVINYDGELVGVVGGIGAKTESLGLNRAVGTVDEDGKVQGVVRQTGSTMKPIAAYALGIDYGIVNYSKGVLDAGILPAEGSSPGTLDWPKNFSKTYRNTTIPLYAAVAESTNTVAAQVGLWVGREQMFEFLVDTLGITSLIDPDDIDIAPLVMGSMTQGMSAYELAGSFMMFGGEETYGVHNTLHCYSKILDSKGNLVMEPAIISVQAISPESGYIMNRLLSNVLRGTGLPGGAVPTAYGMGINGEMDSVAKTGTTSDDRDRWFVGMTPYYVTAVWWGYDVPDKYDFNNRWSPNARTNVPPVVWKYLMETVQADMPYKAFPAQPGGITEKAFCTISGDLAVAGCPRGTGYYSDVGMPDSCTGHAKAPSEDGDDADGEGDDAAPAEE